MWHAEVLSTTGWSVSVFFLIDILIFHRWTTPCTMEPVLWSNINLPCVLLSVFTILNNSNHTEWCHGVLYQLGKSYFFFHVFVKGSRARPELHDAQHLNWGWKLWSSWQEPPNQEHLRRRLQMWILLYATSPLPVSLTETNELIYATATEEKPHGEECWRLTQVQKYVIRNRS